MGKPVLTTSEKAKTGSLRTQDHVVSLTVMEFYIVNSFHKMNLLN